ncbi:MAG TPA: hypothetical protein VFR97_14065 [Capillimicrobium sp.]|nr:hypothetical protein [Capillimicrobium sp.]
MPPLSARPHPRTPWTASPIREACNYHADHAAVMRYAGTPLCQVCVERFRAAGVGVAVESGRRS